MVMQHRPRNNRKIMESLLLLATLRHTLASTPPGPWHGAPPWVLCPGNTGRREGGWSAPQGGRGRHLNSVGAGAALPGPRGAGGPQACVCLCGSPAVVMAGAAREEAGTGTGTGRLFPGPAWRVNKQPSRAARVNGGGATGRRALPRHWHPPPSPLPPHGLALLAPTCPSLPHKPAAPHTRWPHTGDLPNFSCMHQPVTPPLFCDINNKLLLMLPLPPLFSPLTPVTSRSMVGIVFLPFDFQSTMV